MGIEGTRRSVLQVGGGDNTRGHALFRGEGRERLQRLTLSGNAEVGVVGLMARSEGCARGCRVGDAVVERPGTLQSDILRTVEDGTLVVALELHHSYGGEAHAVADKQDDALHLLGTGREERSKDKIC